MYETPVGSSVLVDLDTVDAETVVELGRRYRAHGVGFTAATRSVDNVPFTVRQNLAFVLSQL